jgi:hypothetical protein
MAKLIEIHIRVKCGPDRRTRIGKAGRLVIKRLPGKWPWIDRLAIQSLFDQARKAVEFRFNSRRVNQCGSI